MAGSPAGEQQLLDDLLPVNSTARAGSLGTRSHTTVAFELPKTSPGGGPLRKEMLHSPSAGDLPAAAPATNIDTVDVHLNPAVNIEPPVKRKRGRPVGSRQKPRFEGTVSGPSTTGLPGMPAMGMNVHAPIHPAMLLPTQDAAAHSLNAFLPAPPLSFATHHPVAVNDPASQLGNEKRGRGRPKGSKNIKPAIAAGPNIASAIPSYSPMQAPAADTFAASGPAAQADSAKRARGRPKGSASKADSLPVVVVDVLPGQDIVTHILRVLEYHDRAGIVYSARGCVCGVTLEQTAGGLCIMSNQPMQILQMSGALELGPGSSSIGLVNGGWVNIQVATTSGILSGKVVGSLVAGTPVQAVLGLVKQSGQSSGDTTGKAESTGDALADPTQAVNMEVSSE